MTRTRPWATAAVVAVAALALAACTGSGGDPAPSSTGPSGSSPAATGFDAATTGVVNPTTTSGGTLRVGMAFGDCDSWDPQRTILQSCWTLQRMFTRTLMAWAPEPGTTAVVPDLATAPGAANADRTVWTYTMRADATWQDGTPVTSQDVKYGLERLYAQDVISGGPSQYFLCLLDDCDAEGNPTYLGPYADKTGGLDRISTPDATTIVFSLTRPFGDFDQLVALPTTAPVPQAGDTGKNYGQDVVSSGPYQFADYQPGTSVSWVRNPNWKQDSDPVRTPLADRVEGVMYADPDDADKRLIAGNIDVMVDAGLGQAAQAQVVTDPELLAQADNPQTPFVNYFALFPTAPPLQKLACREAVQYAMNKKDLLVVEGGKYGGTIANSMTPTVLPGFDPAVDPFPAGADGTGDLDLARQKLVECGKPDGFTLKLAYVPIGRGEAYLAAVQQALGRVGITVEGAPGNPQTYYSTFIGSPTAAANAGIGMAWASYGPDFPAPITYWSPIASGSAIKPEGNRNFPQLDLPVLNDLIAETESAPADQLADLDRQIDDGVMADASYVPYLHLKVLWFRNPRATNVYVLMGSGGFYDVVNMGVSQG